MNLYQKFETNKNLEVEGAWLSLSEETGFLVARAGGSNRKHAELMAAKTKPYRHQIQNDSLPDSKYKKIVIESFVDACLKDWRGVSDKEGKPLLFTRENAIKLFTDLPDLFSTLYNYASEASTFREQQVEELGNSSSDTSEI